MKFNLENTSIFFAWNSKFRTWIHMYKMKDNDERDFLTQLVSLLAGAGFLRSTVCCPLVTTWLVTLSIVWQINCLGFFEQRQIFAMTLF